MVLPENRVLREQEETKQTKKKQRKKGGEKRKIKKEALMVPPAAIRLQTHRGCAAAGNKRDPGEPGRTGRAPRWNSGLVAGLDRLQGAAGSAEGGGGGVSRAGCLGGRMRHPRKV